MGYSAEEAILLAALQTVTRDKPLPPLPPVSWATLMGLANAHQVDAIVAYALQSGEYKVPQPVLNQLATRARRQRVRTAVQTDDFDRVAGAFDAAGVDFVALKGVALAHTIYPSPTLRAFNDLDLLIRPNDASLALTVLDQLGFEPHPTAPSGDWHHLAPVRHPQRRTVVELHTDVARRFRPNWSVSGLWDRTEMRSVAGTDVRVLALEDQIVHTALHARHTLFGRMRDVFDFALLMAEPVDPETLVAHARDAGGLVAIRYLQTIAHRWGLLDPASGIVEFKAAWRCAAVAPWRTLDPRPGALTGGPLVNLLEVLLLDSWRDAGRLARTLARPAPEFIQRAPQYDSDNRYGTRANLRLRRLAQDMLSLLAKRARRK